LTSLYTLYNYNPRPVLDPPQNNISLKTQEYLGHERIERFQAGCDNRITSALALVTLDYLSRDGADLVLYDWKMGTPREDDGAQQMRSYARWASERFGADSLAMAGRIVYLRDGSIRQVGFT
jgi:hypothetical protein